MNPPSSGPQKRKNNQNLLGVVVLLGAALFFVFLAMLPDRQAQKRKVSSSQASAYSQKAENRVNQHLFMTGKKIDLEQQQAALKNDFYAPSVGDSIWPKAKERKYYGVDHSPDVNEVTAYEDLNRDSRELNYESPNAVIQGQLHDMEKSTQYEQEYKKEYVRQFVENARRNGYSVTVNENFVVTKVVPLRRPTQESKLFNSSGAGAR